MISPGVRFLLEDIVAYGREAIDAVAELDAEAILSERFRAHAVLRTVQIVGEASAQILKIAPDGIEGLALRDAVGVRNVLVHGYAKLRMEKVVLIVRESLPVLVAGAERLLAEGKQT